MTDAQKEYIITEKLLSELEYYAKGSWVYEVRSRPYKNSDAVLDDIERAIHKLPPATTSKDVLLWEIVFDGLKKLRQKER